MSLALTSPLDTRLAVPLESQTASPSRATVPPTGVTVRTPNHEVAAIRLLAPHLPFRGRTVLDPRQLEEKQYADDERAGILAQARDLADRAHGSEVVWARYAQALLSAGEIDDAIAAAVKTLRMASRVSPDADDNVSINTARFVAARVLSAAGNHVDAEAALAKLTGEGPWTALYAALAERRGEHRQALARLGDARSIEALAFRGFLLLQVNEPQLALAQLRAAQRGGSNAPSLLLNMAYAYAMLGSSRKAVRAARQAVVLAPDSRHASFNLASYLRAAGLAGEALAELRRLRAVVGDGDPQVASAIAGAYVACDNPRQALRELRRAKHHNTFGRRSTRYAELVANAALLEWMLGERDRTATLKVVREQLKAAGPQLSLVLMLADIANRTDTAQEIDSLHRQLQVSLPEAELAPLTIRLLLLKGDVTNAARAAVAHADANPLDVDAVRGAIILHGQVFGDYEAAAEMGKRALRRIPADPSLVNNAAFCLALAGHTREADKVLAGHALDNPFLLATRGLVDFGLGKVADGIARYDEAARLIRSKVRHADDAGDFEQLLRTNEVLALFHFGLATHPDVPIELRTALVPARWQCVPGYLLLRKVAERLHVPWIDSTENSPASE